MSRRAWILTLVMLSFVVSAGAIACGSSSSEGGASGEGSGGGGTGSGGGGGSGTTDAPVGPRPAGASGLSTQMDLLEIAHLADVDHHGLYIDFGTAARMKYTLGQWRSGWGSDVSEGDETFSRATKAARVYYDLREQGPVTLRFRLRAVGTGRLQVFHNNDQIPFVDLAQDGQFHDVDVAVPAASVRAGENYALLRFGGETRVGDENVAADIASLRVIPGTPTPDEHFAPPDHGSLVSQVELGGVERPALTARAPTTLSYYLEIPQGGRFVFGVGAEGAASTATAHVTVQAEGAEAQELWTGPVGNRWSDQSIDLASVAGQVVRLSLRVDGSAEGRVAWSTPEIMVPPPTVAGAAGPVKNVVVLLIDTLRASKLRAYEPESRVRTPVLDGLVQHGVVFERAQSQENWTKPSVASVLTGLTPGTHHATTTEARLPESAELVSESFDRAGFATGSFIANGYVSDRFGFDQGWDHYTNMIREGRSTEAEDVFREAGDFIEQHRQERFFVYIQTIDPHVPYDPPAEYLSMYDSRTEAEYGGIVRPRMTGDLLEQAKRTPPGVTFDASDQRRLEALHDGEITYHDHFLGEFMSRLAALGVADDTLLVITSDHGEEFRDHESWGHGHSVYQELLGVPLIFHRPGLVPEGQRRPQTVSTYNIAQTILDATDVDGLAAAEGRSLLPDIRGEAPRGFSVAFSHMLDDRRVIRAGRWKMVLNGTNTKMFDLESDPHEQREVTDMTRWPIAERYCRILLGQYLGARNRGQWWRAEQRESRELTQEAAQMDETIRAQLRALGYAN